MKLKSILITLGIIIVVVIAAFRIYLYPRLPYYNGYAAQVMCSAYYLSHLKTDRIQHEELGFIPSFIIHPTVDTADKAAISSFYGLQERKAVYRKGCGCALVNKIPAEQLRSAKRAVHTVSFNPLPIWKEDSMSEADKSDLARIKDAIEDAFREKDPNKPLKKTRAVVVLYHGKVLGEKYAPGITASTPLLGWSMTKSLTGTVTGAMVRDGYWQMGDSSLLPEWKSDSRKSITLNNLMHMQSGLKWTEEYDRVSNATNMLFKSDSMGLYTASQPLAYNPGTHWEYSSGTTNLIAYLMSRHFNSIPQYQAYFYNVFSRIGVKSLTVQTDGAGYFVGSSYGYAAAEDWARVGELYLNKGVWKGDTIFNPSWVDYIKEPASNSKGRYGAQFWLNLSGKLPDLPADMYVMDGYQQQRVFIIPSLDVVVVRIGTTYKSDYFDFNHWLQGIVQPIERMEDRRKQNEAS